MTTFADRCDAALVARAAYLPFDAAADGRSLPMYKASRDLASQRLGARPGPNASRGGDARVGGDRAGEAKSVYCRLCGA